MSDADHFMEPLRQLEFDIEQLKVDISMVMNEELRVFIRSLIFEKQKIILAWHKEFGQPAGGQ